MPIEKELFGMLEGVHPVYAYTLRNMSSTSIRVMEFGGSLLNIWTEDKNGNVDDVIFGYDDVNDYITSGGHHGALVGRCGNRIGNSTFTLDGVTYRLNANEGKHHLHGGLRGFSRRFWEVQEGGTEEEPALIMTKISPDGEENYPGTLIATVTYTLTATGALKIHYKATTDKPTVVNLTNHAYFNLSGYQKGNIGTHHLWLDADKINEIDREMIPTGELSDVDGTPYDFRTMKSLGDAIGSDHPDVRYLDGFDNNFILTNFDGTVRKQATLYHPESGRVMNVYTDQPCIQVYTSNKIKPTAKPFKGGIPQRKHFAVCLETQAMPDSIHHPEFTNVVLRPGEVYETTTIYEFTCK